MDQTDQDIKLMEPAQALQRSLLVAAIAIKVPQAEQIITKLFPENVGISEKDLQKAARHLHIRIERKVVSINEVFQQAIPNIIALKDGRYAVLGRSTNKQVLIFFPESDRPILISHEQFSQIWAGTLWLIEKKITIAEIKQKLNFSWFMPVVLHYRKYFYEIVVASLFLQIFGLALPLFTQVIIDKVVGNNGISTLDILAGSLVVAGIFQAVMSGLRTYLMTHTTNKIDVILGVRLLRHIFSMPLLYFENRRVGDTLMRIGSMNSIREFLTGSVITSMLDAVFAIVFIGIMLFYSVPLTLVALISVPIYFLQNIAVTEGYQRRLQEVWQAGAENNSFLVESVTGIHTIKSLALEPQFNHKWEHLTGRYVRKSFDNMVFNMLLGNSSSTIDRLAGFAVLWYGGYQVMSGYMTLGQLIAFQMLASQASAPLLRLVSLWQTVQQTALSLERLGDIICTPPETNETIKQHTVMKGDIQFDSVTFRYRPDNEPVINEISFDITAGMRIGIVGRSGSGKSTITKLMQRLYVPEAGSVRIDGIDVGKIDPVWLRRQIGVVMQENYLFSGSVRENISLAYPSAPMNEVIEAARTAGAHDFILELPEGYDTQVGERGTSLSGGQRQRIAIARAILTNPRLLIFDEATSALDYESERIIMDNLDLITKDRTMVTIAHRLSTVRHSDKIFVVDRGRIAESGTHDELILQQGIYYKLYQEQEGIEE